MFRDITRKKQKLSLEECKEILKQEVRGVLAVNGDDGYPYALPSNFYVDEKGNKLYLHSGKVGHKLDAIANSDKVSFCVYDKGYHKDGHWSLNIRIRNLKQEALGHGCICIGKAMAANIKNSLF